jgi:hypothetical protein
MMTEPPLSGMRNGMNRVKSFRFHMSVASDLVFLSMMRLPMR